MKRLLCLVNGHRFSDWQFVADDLCEKTRSCARCGAEETRVEHADFEWKYIASRSCVGHGYCTRCRSEGPEEVRHAVQPAAGCTRCDFRAETTEQSA